MRTPLILVSVLLLGVGLAMAMVMESGPAAPDGATSDLPNDLPQAALHQYGEDDDSSSSDDDSSSSDSDSSAATMTAD